MATFLETLRRKPRQFGVVPEPLAQLDAELPVLRVTNLSKQYGKTVALDDVSLQIAPGETLGIIGPNGAGKTTLLSLIAGQQRPTAGSVWLGAHRMDTASPHEAARRGIVLAHQIPRPFARMTVRQNLRVASLAAAGRNAHVDRHAAVEAVLAQTGLAAKADKPAGDITLLDRKRLGLARAMIARPILLLLDEVAAGLTIPEIEQLLALIVQLRDDGTTIAIVEHVDNVIRELASRVVVLDWGRVIADGTPAAIARDERVREIYLGRRLNENGSSPKAPTVARAARAGSPLLELSNVTARYNGPPALRDLDFAVHAGEIVAVLGANGAGKTTLARLISGVLTPTAGTLCFDGHDLAHVPAHRRAERGLASSPEGRRIFTDLTVDENLEIGAYPKRARPSSAATKAWIYELFPTLHERAQRFGNELSGGQQQMLAIGRALMASPRLLVLDEASLGLAPVMIDTIYEAIAKIRARGVTVMLIEQSAYRALAIADYVYVLDHGVRTFAGSPHELRNEATLSRAYFGNA